MNNVNILHARLVQARACVAAIDVVLGDRDANPGDDTMSDEILQGLASAALELLGQADEAAEGWIHAAKVRHERQKGDKREAS